MEIKDTFGAYRGEWVCVDEKTFCSLPAATQLELLDTREADERNLFCWPSTAPEDKDTKLLAYLHEGTAPSQHARVTTAEWDGCAQLLPGARRLAGTFPRKSGPNCFGNVMAAAGAVDESARGYPDQFDDFLTHRADLASGAELNSAGKILVWRKGDGRPDHTCITLGGGWILNKQGQAWWSPYYVWDVETALRMESGRGAFEVWQLQIPSPPRI
ncbi:MAG: hypothetical protein ACRCWS_06085 [Propionibacteriaceae bacterium]